MRFDAAPMAPRRASYCARPPSSEPVVVDASSSALAMPSDRSAATAAPYGAMPSSAYTRPATMGEMVAGCVVTRSRARACQASVEAADVRRSGVGVAALFVADGAADVDAPFGSVSRSVHATALAVASVNAMNVCRAEWYRIGPSGGGQRARWRRAQRKNRSRG